MTRYADFQPSPPYFITTSQIPASVQPGCVHVGNSVMTDTWQNLRFPHYGLRPQVLGLETLFTLSTSAFQVPKFCCCDLLFYTSQRCCFMAFEKQSHFYHCSRIWGGSGKMKKVLSVFLALFAALCLVGSANAIEKPEKTDHENHH